MNAPTIILSTLGIIAAAGGMTAYFKSSAGKSNRELLESNVEAYKDSAKLKDQRIAYLEGQVYSKDLTIDKLSRKKK